MLSAQKVGSKRVFLFTNEDDPHRGDIGLRSASKVRAKDLQEFGILVDLFDIDKPGEKFDRTLFYQVGATAAPIRKFQLWCGEPW